MARFIVAAGISPKEVHYLGRLTAAASDLPPDRDQAEEDAAAVVDAATQTFLARVLTFVLAAIKAGDTASLHQAMPLGTMLGWWSDTAAEKIVDSIRRSWQAAFGVTLSGETVVTPRADAMAFHIAAVRDRLSRSALPEIPQDAFDQVRLSLSGAALEGWSIPQLSRDIALRLAWEPNKAAWEAKKRASEDAIDKILDPLGKPGTPARTYAHKYDPEVIRLQAIRAEAVTAIHADESTWKARATTIARTENTSAWNSGALAALQAEGRTHKKWLATKDKRTRESHLAANGQVVPLTEPFHVGESVLMMPGDPAGPAREVIGCRCTVVGADAKPGSMTGSAVTYLQYVVDSELWAAFCHTRRDR